MKDWGRTGPTVYPIATTPPIIPWYLPLYVKKKQDQVSIHVRIMRTHKKHTPLPQRNNIRYDNLHHPNDPPSPGPSHAPKHDDLDNTLGEPCDEVPDHVQRHRDAHGAFAAEDVAEASVEGLEGGAGH
jgi:hypothetical protein